MMSQGESHTNPNPKDEKDAELNVSSLKAWIKKQEGQMNAMQEILQQIVTALPLRKPSAESPKSITTDNTTISGTLSTLSLPSSYDMMMEIEESLKKWKTRQVHPFNFFEDKAFIVKK